MNDQSARFHWRAWIGCRTSRSYTEPVFVHLTLYRHFVVKMYVYHPSAHSALLIRSLPPPHPLPTSRNHSALRWHGSCKAWILLLQLVCHTILICWHIVCNDRWLAWLLQMQAGMALAYAGRKSHCDFNLRARATHHQWNQGFANWEWFSFATDSWQSIPP